MRITGFYKTLFGYKLRTLPDDNNDTQKLTFTSTFRYRLIPLSCTFIKTAGTCTFPTYIIISRLFGGTSLTW